MKRMMIFTIVSQLLLADILEEALDLNSQEQIVIATKKIEIEGFPEAQNPSILKIGDKFLLVFRVVPDSTLDIPFSYMGIVVLDETFQPISKPQLLDPRHDDPHVPSHAEDARLLTYHGRIFLIYNDHFPSLDPKGKRRDMYIAELFQNDGAFSLSLPLKLVHEEKHPYIFCQKNWTPFEYDQKLLVCYSIEPHEILYVNLNNGSCHRLYETEGHVGWKWGHLRGSTIPQLIDGEFLSFFHSGIRIVSSASERLEMWHYFMGAYTFSAEPPFKITKISPLPLIAQGFYTPSSYIKRVIFPGGFVVSGDVLYVAYGKDDREIWIATVDKEALKRSLVEVK